MVRRHLTEATNPPPPSLRSDEAIQLSFRSEGWKLDCFASLAMTVERHAVSFPRLVFARVIQFRCPSLREGAGKAGRRMHPQPGGQKKTSPPVSPPRVQPDTPAFPAQWFDGFLRALPGERRFCHRCLRDTSRKIDATVAAPGPHDFAVRCGVLVRQTSCLTPQRPSHPAPTFRDDREASLSGRDEYYLLPIYIIVNKKVPIYEN